MEYYDKKKVGDRIREVRRVQDMTQAELSEKLAYTSDRQIQRIESGNTACSVDKLMEISQAVHTSTDYLLFGEKESDGLYKDIIFQIVAEKNEREAEFFCHIIKAINDNLSVLSHEN